MMIFFFNDTATTEIYSYCHTLSLHDALPICFDERNTDRRGRPLAVRRSELRTRCLRRAFVTLSDMTGSVTRSEEHTSELQSLMRNSYAVFCLKKKIKYSNKYSNL